MTDSDEQDSFPGTQANTVTHLNAVQTPTVRRKEGIRTWSGNQMPAIET